MPEWYGSTLDFKVEVDLEVLNHIALWWFSLELTKVFILGLI